MGSYKKFMQLLPALHLNFFSYLPQPSSDYCFIYWAPLCFYTVSTFIHLSAISINCFLPIIYKPRACNSLGACSVRDVLMLKYWLWTNKCLKNNYLLSHQFPVVFASFLTFITSELKQKHSSCSVRDALKLIH